jgi:hypothetical protein
MHRNQNKVSVVGGLVLLLFILNAVVLERGLVSDPRWYRVLYLTIPLFLIAVLLTRKKTT